MKMHPFHRRSPALLLPLLASALLGCEAPEAPVAPEYDVAASHGGAHRPLNAAAQQQLVALRQATAPFHNFEKAKDAGYAVDITPCWESVTQGAMGYHYGNPELLFDSATVDLLAPETLMFEPGPGGQMKLVGMEYIVFIDEWEDVHGVGAAPPSLLGQVFHPHSFLPIYKLHIWLWRDNPRGMFADWNPKVSCDHAEQAEYFP
jgi:hypothetical protein